MNRSPEGYNSLQPSSQTETVIASGAFIMPDQPEGTSLQLIETYRTPEGYDVSTIAGARAYLTEVHGYDLTTVRNGREADEALANIERAAIYKDGRHQNDKEHTDHLWALIEENSPEWTLKDRVIGKRFTRVHDWPEINGRDTGINDELGLATKFFREEAGITLLVADLGYYHPDIQAMLKYHGKIPMTPDEQRIFNRVHTFDKIEPYVFQIQQEAALHIARHETLRRIARQALPKLVTDPTALHKGKLVLAELGEILLAKSEKLVDGDPATIIETISDEVIAEHIRNPALWGPPEGSPKLGKLVSVESSENRLEALQNVTDLKQYKSTSSNRPVDPVLA